MSISIYLRPDSDWERRILDHSTDESPREYDLFRDLPDDGIAREEWLDTCPDTEHKRIIPRSDRRNHPLGFVSDDMDLSVRLIYYLRNKTLLGMIEIPEHIAESIADLITSESDRHAHLSRDTRGDGFFLSCESVIEFPQESDSLGNWHICPEDLRTVCLGDDRRDLGW